MILTINFFYIFIKFFNDRFVKITQKKKREDKKQEEKKNVKSPIQKNVTLKSKNETEEERKERKRKNLI